jgi:predicted ATP-grasp superfamily ATP-dependent carboligase
MSLRVFAYEYSCSARQEEARMPSSFSTEGAAMLLTVLADLARVPGVELVTLLNRSTPVTLAGQPCRVVRTDEEEAAFRDLARGADFTLVIAPEVHDLLWTRSCWVEESGGRLLGSSPAAVRMTGDKLELCHYLEKRRIATPASLLIAPGMAAPPFAFPVVCKPRFGAGSIATFLVRSAEDWERCRDLSRAEGWSGEDLVQPFVPGQTVCVAFLVGSSQSVALMPATQELSDDGRFRYRGGRLPLPAPLAKRAVSLASRAIPAISGLRGYVGVDVVLGNEADGSRDWIIEVNPRLTTSYVGLRALARTNLAEAMLRVVMSTDIPAIEWSAGSVRFQPDGMVADK